jgi:hypothetical protein
MTDGLAAPPAPASTRTRPIALAWLAGRLRAEALMWREAGCRLLGRPLPSERHARSLGEGRRFPLHRGSNAGVLLPMIVLSTLVDIPLCHGVIHVTVRPEHRLPLHLLTLAANVWMLAWALAFRSAVRHVDHVLGDDRLTLATGLAQVARIPLSAIRALHLVDTRAADWMAPQALARGDVTVLAPLDKPTLLIALHPDAGARLETNGVERPLRPWIAVYVDKPRELVAALQDAMARPQVSGIAQPRVP